MTSNETTQLLWCNYCGDWTKTRKWIFGGAPICDVCTRVQDKEKRYDQQ